MDCKQCREEIARLLEADWESQGPPRELSMEAIEHAQTCPRCKPLAEAARQLATGELDSVEAPGGLADRVADTILEEDPSEAKGLRIFRSGSLPLSRWAVQAAAALFLVIVSAFITTMVVSSPGSEEAVVTVRLELRAPEARRVAVVGDWNGWDPSMHPMTDADNDGIWEIEVEVQQDREYQYQFLVNGERWIPDPEAPMTVSDGFGGENSVLNI